jgi:preprotein translocase subunit YajC
MVASTYGSLPRRARRRLVARALVRPAVTAGGLGLLYYRLPLGAARNAHTLVGFVLGLAALVVLIAWQARAITKAPYPRVRAIEALATTVAFFLFLFAAAYFLIARSQPDAFSEALSRTDALYLAVTILTSVGFGDIVARTDGTRVLVMVQMLGSLALLGAGARVLLAAVQTGLRKSRDRDD